jgi:hypothetical protein
MTRPGSGQKSLATPFPATLALEHTSEGTTSMTHRSLKSLLFGLALGAGLLSTAQAQSSSGNIVGDAVAGETIIVRGADTGFHREVKVNEDGRYTIRRIPTGTYTVVKTHADGTAGTAQTLVVRVGSTARIE